MTSQTDFKTQDLVSDITKAFLSVIQDYTQLSEDLCVIIDNDHPIEVSARSFSFDALLESPKAVLDL